METLVKADSIKGADNKTTLVDVVANLALTTPGDAKAMQNLATVCVCLFVSLCAPCRG